MNKFVDRQEELAELNRLLGSVERGHSEFAIIYGRRRIGKTTLLLNWAEQSNLPYIYWVARRETPAAARQSFARTLWRWAYPEEPDPQPPTFHSWETLFEQMNRMVGEEPLLMIWDEFSYAADSDKSLPSHLQAAWDHMLKYKPLAFILAGSHIGMMVDLMGYHAPLYGRFTGQLMLKHLPFACLADFFPNYSPEERVATYAVLGGVAGYWERFNPEISLAENIHQHLFTRMGMFRSEPMILIGDVVREPRHYEAVLRAIATGAHTPAQIAEITGVASTNLSPYLKRLVDLGFVERRIPATVPPAQRRNTTRSQYHVADPYLRFYFRFMEPNLELLAQGRITLLWERISERFRTFIGETTWRQLCREWVLEQADEGHLPFQPELVGNHWSGDVEVDVVAVNWQEKQILLGLCQWNIQPISRNPIRDLVDMMPSVRPGREWQVHYIFFARGGFTELAQAEGAQIGAQLVDLHQLDHDRRRYLLDR